MILTVVDDFSSSVVLDNELMNTPDSGLYLNRGVLPIVTINNLLAILPLSNVDYQAWDAAKTYKKYETSISRSDVVYYESKLYQSLKDSNIGKAPDSNSDYWLPTNTESLKIKAFIRNAQENLLSQLSLHKKLIENQYIYDLGKNLVTPTNDYVGWAFEPKGSDYVKIKINQISLQANTATPVNMYVINQGKLLETIVLNPNNGVLEFENVGYTISGKGRFLFVINATEVYSNNAYNDSLKYDGFVCYPVQGDGTEPETATYSESMLGNGMNFNVSAYLDSTEYVTNNLIHFGRALQAQAEIDFLNTLRFNANVRTNNVERNIGVDKAYLDFQANELNANTVGRKYREEIKSAKESINQTFDRFLKAPKKITIKRTSF